jgi:hemolysin III
MRRHRQGVGSDVRSSLIAFQWPVRDPVAMTPAARTAKALWPYRHRSSYISPRNSVFQKVDIMHAVRSKAELANAITHGAGVLLSVAGGALLIALAALSRDALKITSAAIFTASLILLYSASTLYHAAREPSLKSRLQIVDHAAIYVLIAGTYTPFVIGVLRGGWGWSLFGVIWGAAAAGVIFKLFFTGRFPRLSTGIYIAMGWLALLAARPLIDALAPGGMIWLLAGGVAYTAGTVFYHSERLPYAHAVWHVFVIAGSICHGVAVATQL